MNAVSNRTWNRPKHIQLFRRPGAASVVSVAFVALEVLLTLEDWGGQV